MPPKENPKSAARPANKKRPAAPDEESHRFVKRIAQHLREAAESPNTGDDFAWDEARIAKAFCDAVENLPPGAIRDKLKAHLDVLRAKLRGEQLLEFGRLAEARDRHAMGLGVELHAVRAHLALQVVERLVHQ